jgi:hypothetical protein
MEARKQELRMLNARKESEVMFQKYWHEFMNGLQGLLPPKTKLPKEPCTSLAFWNEFHMHRSLVTRSDETLMLKGVPLLLRLRLPQNWILNKWDAETKDVIWKFLKLLLSNAVTLHAPAFVTEHEETSVTENKTDSSGFGIDSILKSYPKELIAKMEQCETQQDLMKSLTTDDYAALFESGAKSLKGMPLQQMMSMMAMFQAPS